jgi:uncharacterized protein YgiM (DUF1202 family)
MKKTSPQRLGTAVVCALILFLESSTVFAGIATVTRSSNLRANPDSSSAVLKLLNVSTQLSVLDTTPQNGYLHVRTVEGQEGWIWGKNLTVSAEKRASRSSQPFAVRAARARAKKSEPCATSLDQCPLSGCENPESPHGLLNITKRHLLPDGTPETLTFAQLRTLQRSTDLKGIVQGADIHDRSVLKDLDIGEGRTVSEGALVEVVGFISPDRTLGPGSAESVNCRLKKVNENDVHIPVAEDSEGSEFDSLVVEPIPQDRPPTWNVALWKQIQTDGTKIRVRGQLLYDNLHLVNDNPEHPQGTEPKRFTLWEVHPITAIFECAVPANGCDPRQEGDWIRVQ